MYISVCIYYAIAVLIVKISSGTKEYISIIVDKNMVAKIAVTWCKNRTPRSAVGNGKS